MEEKKMNSTTKKLARCISIACKAKQKPNNHGTSEWSVKTVNCCTGCSHDCVYCYAKEMALRFGQITASQWPLEQIRQPDVRKRHKKYDGQIMFPSSHDITPNNLASCLTVLEKLFYAGNQVLVVSKPHLECIEKICDAFKRYRNQILFRFTIGACDDKILSFWEPNAPGYDERRNCLVYSFMTGFQTSVSVEPMLDSANIDMLIEDLMPFVSDSIWIGIMNHTGRFGKNANPVLQQAIEKIGKGQANSVIKTIYQRHKNNPMIKWKAEIKKIVGIPLPKKPGMDI
jgi:DNA repair photolyase